MSFTVLFGWVGVLLFKIKGIPVSLSETRYLVNHRKVGHLLWYLMCTLTAIPLMIVWIYYLNKYEMEGQILAYLTCLALVGVGIAGDFKDAGWKFFIHCLFALISAGACVVWICLYSPLAFIIIPIAIFFTLVGLWTGGRSAENRVGKPKRNAIVFYLEFVCFLAIYLCIYGLIIGI